MSSVSGPGFCRCDTACDGVVIAEVPGFLVLGKQQQFEQDSGKWGIMSARCPNVCTASGCTHSSSGSMAVENFSKLSQSPVTLFSTRAM